MDYAKISNKKDVVETEPVIEDVVEELEITETVEEFVKQTAVVYNCARLYVRSEPNTNAKQLDVIDRGTEVTIIGECEDWYNIVVPYGVTGWSMKKYFEV